MIASRFLVPGLLLVLSLVSGLWLSHSGRPLNTAVLTIHKLLALAMAVSTALVIYHLRKGAGISTTAWLAVVLTALPVVALFLTGALLSAGKQAHGLMLTTHQVAPVLVAAAGAVTVFLLAGGRTP